MQDREEEDGRDGEEGRADHEQGLVVLILRAGFRDERCGRAPGPMAAWGRRV